MAVAREEPAWATQPPDRHAALLPVRQAQAGDRTALHQLFAQSQRRVMGYCLLSARGDREKALDLTQETFTRAFRSLHTLADPERFSGWLLTIAANVCRSQGNADLRRRRLLQSFAVEQDLVSQQEDKVTRERRIAAVRAVLHGIEDPTLRRIVELKYGEPEYTTREIAAQLGIPHGTVTVKLMRFRNAAKRDLWRAVLEAEEEELP